MMTHQEHMRLIFIISLILTYAKVKTESALSMSDPCFHYTVLDEPWRATNYSSAAGKRCDQSVTWSGWYRLLYLGQDIRMPEACVNSNMCSTDAPLWITSPHPLLLEGEVTRQVCGNWNGDCCNFKSNPIQVKACPDNYYVYKFVSPSGCSLAYCADVTTIKPAVFPTITTPYHNAPGWTEDDTFLSRDPHTVIH